jgi:hypothetical protein
MLCYKHRSNFGSSHFEGTRLALRKQLETMACLYCLQGMDLETMCMACPACGMDAERLFCLANKRARHADEAEAAADEAEAAILAREEIEADEAEAAAAAAAAILAREEIERQVRADILAFTTGATAAADKAEAGDKLRDLLLSEYTGNQMTAKQVCSIAHWVTLAGGKGVEDLATTGSCTARLQQVLHPSPWVVDYYEPHKPDCCCEDCMLEMMIE